MVVPSPPPKAAPVVSTPSVGEPAEAATAIETFTVGVSDVMFNSTNAIFGRLLKVPGGHIVTLAYWNQKETVSNDDLPYYDRQ